MPKHSMARLSMAVLLLAAIPHAAGAQLGALKRLKNAVSPDSAARAAAAARDSAALAAKLAAGDTTPLQRSKLARAVSAAASASQKFEAATGVSVTDAALAATGVGASGLVAKKLAGDPKTAGAQALGRAIERRAQSAQGPRGVTGLPGVAGIPGAGDLTALMRTQASAAGGRTPAVGPLPTGGFNEADLRALVAFQEEMMQVTTAAGAGDAAAQARLQRLEAIALRHQPELERLALAASGGDLTAVQRMQTIQIEMIREWTGAKPAARPGMPKAPTRGRP